MVFSVPIIAIFFKFDLLTLSAHGFITSYTGIDKESFNFLYAYEEDVFHAIITPLTFFSIKKLAQLMLHLIMLLLLLLPIQTL